jgi:PAS domain S-box-containing protein
MRLRYKLLMVAHVPVAAAIALAAVVVVEGRERARDAEHLSSLEEIAGVLKGTLTVISDLQTARLPRRWLLGNAVAIESGVVEEASRAQELNEKRALWESANQSFVTNRDALFRAFDGVRGDTALSKQTESVHRHLQNIPDTFELLLSADPGATFYTSAIEDLLGILGRLKTVSRDAALSNRMASLYTLGRFAEKYGQVDATVVGAYGEIGFGPGRFRALITEQTELNQLRGLLADDADASVVRQVQTALSDPGVMKADATLSEITRAIDDKLPGDEKTYHNAALSRMKELRRIEDELVDRLIDEASRLASEASFRVKVGLTGAGLVILIGLVAFALSRRLLRSVDGIAKAAEGVLTSENYNIRAVRISNDEIGTLADSFNRMLSEVQLRDARLREHQANLSNEVDARTRDLKIERDRNAAILSTAGAAIVGVDAHGMIVFLNPAALKLLEARAVDVMGKPGSRVLDWSSRRGKVEPADHAIACALRSGETQTLNGITYRTPSGKDRSLSGTVTPMGTNGSDGAVAILDDVTDRQAMESRLNESNKLESIGQLAAGVAHEINTPMQFIGDNVTFLEEACRDIQGLLDAYRDATVASVAQIGAEKVAQLEAMAAARDLDFLKENVPESIKNALEGVRRVSKIVQAMKDFSHMGSEQKEASDINRAIESTITVSANVWKHVARMETVLAPDLPFVSCHIGDINQVVLNIVVNASHAIADQGRDVSSSLIKIETSSDAQNVFIRISDTGGGIPEKVRNRIFDLFFTTKEVGRGTGQGLAISRSVVVDKHYGSLDFETEVGQGTTFTIRLPINSGTGDHPIAAAV